MTTLALKVFCKQSNDGKGGRELVSHVPASQYLCYLKIQLSWDGGPASVILQRRKLRFQTNPGIEIFSSWFQGPCTYFSACRFLRWTSHVQCWEPSSCHQVGGHGQWNQRKLRAAVTFPTGSRAGLRFLNEVISHVCTEQD